MVPIRNVTEVMDAIAQAKVDASAFSTNLFPVPQKLQDWIDHAELLGGVHDGTAGFLRRDRDFWHFYFCAPNAQALLRATASWPQLRTERVVADIVGTEAASDGLVDILKSAGFRSYKRLFRMARMAPTIGL